MLGQTVSEDALRRPAARRAVAQYLRVICSKLAPRPADNSCLRFDLLAERFPPRRARAGGASPESALATFSIRSRVAHLTLYNFRLVPRRLAGYGSAGPSKDCVRKQSGSLPGRRLAGAQKGRTFRVNFGKCIDRHRRSRGVNRRPY
ncbi:hypothetical protein EVAR_27889_1 [Eumeta japonica]|uniref:Uncharacterized protein n=1 Tax=Eumeta variegata TaxID=151549 RepID=A0A4C1UW80_EUMVA|nr:hypothetical protein EVAR_27889_1 [Eumeta japonica]